MESELVRQIRPGTRVVVKQQIPGGDHVWASTVRGTVVDFQQRTTGSWFAHARDDRLWLDRLTIRKEDGELSNLILDRFSRVELEATAQPAAIAGT